MCAAQSGALSRAEAEEQLTALAGEAVVKGLQSAGWKERLTAMEALQEHLSAMPAAELAAAASAVIQVRTALRLQQICAQHAAGHAGSHLISPQTDRRSALGAGCVVQGLAYLPGWAEKNFQVLAKAFEVIAQLAAADGAAVSKRDAFLSVGGLVDKVADIKLKAAAGEALLALGEAIGPQFVCTQLHKKAAAHRNPKARP